jgi:hypothetical protein
MRLLTLLLLATLALTPNAQAQDASVSEPSAAERLPLAIALGARVTDRPQFALHLYPSERFEIAFSAYSNDWESGIGTNWYGSVSALVRLQSKESLSFRLGANYTHDERARLAGVHPDSDFDAGPRFQPYRWAGPLVGLDYAISDRLTAFADFTVGIDIDIQTVTMNNTGIGLLYRIKKM